MAGKVDGTCKITLTLSQKDKDDLDKVLEGKDMSRSQLIRKIIRVYLDNRWPARK